MKKAPRINSTESKTVGFRLGDESLELLKSKAIAFGISRHDLARNYVMQNLSEADERIALRESAAAHREIAELREDFALAVEALLVLAGKAKKDEARDWVAANFRRK